LLADMKTHVDGNVRAVLVAALARAAGLDGMAGGQMLDLEAENRAMTLDEVRQMQAMKTGALIQYAAAAGGIHGGADEALQSTLELYARDLGLAFQIADDLLDYDGDAELLGKPAGQDADRGKGSFVVLMGLEPARAAAAELIAGAEAALEPWGDAAAPLRSIARFAIERQS
ncbi:MAG: polyprenyl synthetase family protein, partial [Pseudomonadota bacterium]|nr:polyprenyl synthetase family protein [Pseudomonadota bacterium]